MATILRARKPSVRFAADRWRRIWQLAQHVADHPGHSRGELAGTFHLSERQVQDDLDIIRTDMGLPLTRRQGYRFVAEDGVAPASRLTLADAMTLASALARASRVSQEEHDRLAALAASLPAVFPPHLAPLAGRLFRAVAGPWSRDELVFAALCDAILAGATLRLRLKPNLVKRDGPVVLRPELLIPALSRWWVIGERVTNRAPAPLAMLDITSVESVEPYARDATGVVS